MKLNRKKGIEHKIVTSAPSIVAGAKVSLHKAVIAALDESPEPVSVVIATYSAGLAQVNELAAHKNLKECIIYVDVSAPARAPRSMKRLYEFADVRLRYNHAKFAVVGDELLIRGSCNYQEPRGHEFLETSVDSELAAYMIAAVESAPQNKSRQRNSSTHLGSGL